MLHNTSKIVNISGFYTNMIMCLHLFGKEVYINHQQICFTCATRSQSYQTSFFFVFQFLLLSLRVCSKQKKCVYYSTAKLGSKKPKNSSFLKKKSLVGLTPVQNYRLSFVSLNKGSLEK